MSRNKQLLVAQGVSFAYGSVPVLLDVSLRIPPSTVIALMGANGAGKSTLLKVLSCVLPAACGSIEFDRQSLKSASPQDALRMGISLVPEERRIFREQTVEDNLRLGAYIRRRAPKAELAHDRDRIFTLFPVLEKKRREVAGTLSGGQQQMLAVACSLLSRPKLLLLDEPFAGLDLGVVTALMDALLELKRSEMTILLVEQNVRLALALSDRVYVLEHGQVVADKTGKVVMAETKALPAKGEMLAAAWPRQ